QLRRDLKSSRERLQEAVEGANVLSQAAKHQERAVTGKLRGLPLGVLERIESWFFDFLFWILARIAKDKLTLPQQVLTWLPLVRVPRVLVGSEQGPVGQ